MLTCSKMTVIAGLSDKRSLSVAAKRMNQPQHTLLITICNPAIVPRQSASTVHPGSTTTVWNKQGLGINWNDALIIPLL